MKTVLREMSKLSPSSEKFKPKLKVLKDDVEHHAEEEEEAKMFPKVRELVNDSLSWKNWVRNSKEPNINDFARRAKVLEEMTFLALGRLEL